jgi:hypothetical protein
MSKTSLELLREYVDLIKEAEEDFDASDFDTESDDQAADEIQHEGEIEKDDFEQDNSFDNSADPIQELANYLDDQPNDDKDFSTIIKQFLKDKHYDLVPTNSLENSRGDV